jgi:REP element-mobilizing transposase RayT
MEDDGFPLGFLLTFTGYGTWLHGDGRGSVDRRNNTFDSPGLPERTEWREKDRSLLRNTPIFFDAGSRHCIEEAVRSVCDHRKWSLWAINARTNHVHVVVSAAQRPELIMLAFKSWSSRRLFERGLFPKGTRIWTRHGSTRYLWDEPSVDAACAYVEHGQGSPPRTTIDGRRRREA